MRVRAYGLLSIVFCGGFERRGFDGEAAGGGGAWFSGFPGADADEGEADGQDHEGQEE